MKVLFTLGWFRQLSVERKLVVIFMGITLTALLVTGVGFRFHQVRVLKSSLAGDLQGKALVLGANCTAALRFNMPGDTVELLHSLSAFPQIEYACVYDAEEKLFASYPENLSGVENVASLPEPGIQYTKKHMQILHPIIHDGDKVGFILLSSNLTALYSQIRESFVTVLSLFMLSVTIALILARSSVRIISRPLLNLVKTASLVSKTGDYSVRAQKYHPDDFGTLTDRFNEMLNRIQIHEQELKLEQVALEKSRQRERKLQDQLARSERMESLGLLAGGVAHDLNNILGPLVGYPDLMLEQIDKNDPLRKDLEQMKRSATKAAHVIQDLLTLGRRGNYESEPVQINEVIEEYFQSVGCLLLVGKNPHVDLVIHLAPELPCINGTNYHLTQVVMNLILNAVEAMPQGGTLTIQTGIREMVKDKNGLELIPKGKYVGVDISDTGVGISKTDREHIFEPFYTRKVMGRSGSGLGLAVVYGVLKDLGGYVDLVSAKGRGSQFSFYFPISTKTIKPAFVAPLTSTGHERVLIVDDEEEQRHLGERILSSLGYRIDVACTGHDALIFIKQNPYDLVLLDMIMEDEFDGLDTFREIRKMVPDQKCIIVSGFSESERVYAAQREGAGAFVAKPYSRDNLAQVIRHALA